MFAKRKYILGSILFFLIISLSFVVKSVTGTAIIVENSFDNTNDFETVEGVGTSNGSLILSRDGFNYSENFNSYENGDFPVGWTATSTNWNIQNGTYEYVNNNYDNSRTILSEELMKNGEVNADFKFLGGEQLGSIMFRYQNSDNYYEALLTSHPANTNGIVLRKRINGENITMVSIGETLSINTIYNLKVVFDDNNIKVYVDDVLKIDTTDSDIDSSGNVGLWREGTALDVDNFNVVSSIHDRGNMTSKTTNFDSNIQKITMSISGTDLSQTDIFVSNDNGLNWQQIIKEKTLYFSTVGTKFKYRIYLEPGSPVINNISFNLQTGVKDTLNNVIHNDLNMLYYYFSGNTFISDSLNPNYLTFYDSIPNLKMVQQAAIVRRNNKTITYIPDSDNFKLIAYDIGNKTKLWERVFNGEVVADRYLESTPYVNNGVIYIGSYSKKIYAVDQDTGEILWTYLCNSEISGGSIEAKGNILYFNDYGYGGTTKLYAVNITTHELVWSYSIPSMMNISSLIDPVLDRIYVTEYGKLLAFKASTGSFIWESDISLGYINRRPTLVGDKLIVANDRGLAVINKLTGTINWKMTIGSMAEDGLGASPVVENDVMYYPSKNDAKIYARKLSDGSLVWSVDAPDTNGTFASPVLTNDGYLYLSYNSGIRALNKIDGSIVWTSPQKGWVENTVSIGHGYLLFTDPTGTGTINIYRENKENYVSNNGLKINLDDRTITGITVDSVKSSNFTSNGNQLTISDIGNVVIDYGNYPEGSSVPSNIIINPLSENKIAVSSPSGTDTFIYPFGNDSMTDILRDGEIMSRSSWSKSGNLITITDFFNSHIYEAVTIVQNNISNNTDTNFSIPDTSCHDSKPIGVSDLFQINVKGNTAKLFFTPMSTTNNYFVSFSEKPNAEEHGEQVYLLREGVQSHTIYQLKPNTTYYFKVRGQNGCMPGEWSNVMKIKTGANKSTKTTIFYKSLLTKVTNLIKTTKSNITKTKNNNVSKETILPNDSKVTPSPQITVAPQSTPKSPTPETKKKCLLWWCW